MLGSRAWFSMAQCVQALGWCSLRLDCGGPCHCHTNGFKRDHAGGLFFTRESFLLPLGKVSLEESSSWQGMAYKD